MRSRSQLELDSRLRRIDSVARLLPASTARNGLGERMRLRELFARGGHLEPRWQPIRQNVPQPIWRDLHEARTLAAQVPAGELYLARLDELELELMLLEALGESKRVRPLAARRFGTGATRIDLPGGSVALAEIADQILDDLEPSPPEIPTIDVAGPESLTVMVEKLAACVGIEVAVEVEPALVANAACGERTIYLADRRFGAREAQRLAVHEVLGHLTASANGRAQPLAIMQVGTAGSLRDQEGLAIFLEDAAGLLDARRLRTFAARTWVADQMHQGASFHDTVHMLAAEYAFTGDEAIALAERAYRGGGVARDPIYLGGFLRVRHAISAGKATVDTLRAGKVSLDALPSLGELTRRGMLREAIHRPSLSRSLAATILGTNWSTLPPSVAASLMRLDET